MANLSSKIDIRAFVVALDGYYDRDFRAYWVHMDHKDVMTVAGFRPVMVKDNIHGGRKHAMGGVGHYWI